MTPAFEESRFYPLEQSAFVEEALRWLPDADEASRCRTSQTFPSLAIQDRKLSFPAAEHQLRGDVGRGHQGQQNQRRGPGHFNLVVIGEG